MKKHLRAGALSLFFLISGLAPLRSQELTFLWGAMHAPSTGESSFTWQIDYRQNLHRNLAASIAYINEGHITGHHRDGTAAELWARLPLFRDKIEFSLGGGVYYFYDTQYLPGGASTNVHGSSWIFSASATGYLSNRWFYRLMANRIDPNDVIKANDSIKVNTFAIGAGFWFGRGQKPTPGKLGDAPEVDGYITPNELAVFIGQSVVNTFLSESAAAYAVEYRRGWMPHVDWTVTGIYEGDPQIIRRNGLAMQVWAVNTFFDRRIAVGIGLGPYIYIDKKNPVLTTRKIPATVAPLVSLTFSTRLSDHWHMRLVWDRVTTSYDRDADIFRAGLGYSWGDRAEK